MTDFIEIAPRPLQVFPVVNLDLDAPRSLELLARPQQAQRVGWFDPKTLYLQRDFARLPVKAPGTHLYTPEWAEPISPIFQRIADYRQATSDRYQHEWMYMVYDRSYVRDGEPVRLNAGIHLDDPEDAFVNRQGRVSACFIVVSDYPTVFYDGLRGLEPESFQRAYTAWNRQAAVPVDEMDPLALMAARNAYFEPLVYPPEGRVWPAGTLVCATGATPHTAQVADGNCWRAFLHVTAYEGHSRDHEPARLRQLNPPLHRAVYG